MWHTHGKILSLINVQASHDSHMRATWQKYERFKGHIISGLFPGVALKFTRLSWTMWHTHGNSTVSDRQVRAQIITISFVPLCLNFLLSPLILLEIKIPQGVEGIEKLEWNLLVSRYQDDFLSINIIFL